MVFWRFFMICFCWIIFLIFFWVFILNGFLFSFVIIWWCLVCFCFLILYWLLKIWVNLIGLFSVLVYCGDEFFIFCWRVGLFRIWRWMVLGFCVFEGVCVCWWDGFVFFCFVGILVLLWMLWMWRVIMLLLLMFNLVSVLELLLMSLLLWYRCWEVEGWLVLIWIEFWRVLMVIFG